MLLPLLLNNQAGATLGVIGGLNSEHLADSNVLDRGQPVVEEEGGAAGAWPNVSFHILAATGGGPVFSPYEHVYDRIWVIPTILTPLNPELNVDIPFRIWSAYTSANSLDTIVPTDATGLTLDISAPTPFAAVEEMTVNIQIGPTAPAVIDANFLFDFTMGSGTLDFETTLIEWLRILPELPIIEDWEWLTNIIVADNSTEQRSSLRRQPRRRIGFNILLFDDTERAREYKRLHSYIGEPTVTIPFWQYDTPITAPSAISATKIFFNRDGTDFRDGDIAIIYRPSTQSSFLLQTTTIDADGANLNSPLTIAVELGDIVAPGFAGRLANRSGMDMSNVHGQLPFNVEITEFRTQFDRPTSSATITVFDGMNVMDRRVIVTRGPAGEKFDADPQLIESPLGLSANKVKWTHPFVSGGRQFWVPRKKDPVEMDFFRDFFTEIVGMREPWLLPTWFDDLVLDSNPVQGSLQFMTDDSLYAAQFFGNDTYKRFMLTNPDGDIIYRKAADATAQPGDLSLITLENPLPNEVAWGNGFAISFLNKVRLADDRVRLKHSALTTTIDISVRTIDG